MKRRAAIQTTFYRAGTMTDKQKPQDDTSKATEESFAEYPVSITTHKATMHRDAGLWTPRDALVDMLRRIDRGELKPRAIIIGVDFEGEDGDGAMTYNISSPNFLTSVGLAGRVFYSVNQAGDHD